MDFKLKCESLNGKHYFFDNDVEVCDFSSEILNKVTLINLIELKSVCELNPKKRFDFTSKNVNAFERDAKTICYDESVSTGKAEDVAFGLIKEVEY